MISMSISNSTRTTKTNRMIIYTDKISTIDYDEVSQNITYYEHGFAKKELLIDQLRTVMEFSKKNAIFSVIADFRKLQGSFKNIFSYLNDEYYPALRSQGLKCNSFIVSEDIISNHLTNELVKELRKTGIRAAVFSTTKAAGNWVRECKESN